LVPQLADSSLQWEQNPLDGFFKWNDGHCAVESALESCLIERVKRSHQII
jgi:hypothetical protein